MVWKIVQGILLLLVAALGFFATRNEAELLTNPGTAWLCKLIGPRPARYVLMGVAAVIALLGVLVIVMAFVPVEE
jgi:hypothetical protein